MRTDVCVRASCLALLILLAVGGCSHSNGSSSSSGSNSGQSGAAQSPSSDSSFSAAQTQAAPPPVVIPAGRTLVVTLDENVSTKTNSSGDQFAASLAEPVRVNGEEILPVGTRVRGTVVDAESAGRVKGGASLALELDALTVAGEKYRIETSAFEEVGKGRGKRTAVGGGGGAAFGAMIGALAGGGKGAAIGAVAGGGAGTAGAAFTGNRDITLSAETRLHFKLKRSLTLPAPTASSQNGTQAPRGVS
jgi:hypothetical protein